MPIFAAAIIGGGALVGGAIQAGAAKSAANTQAGAAQSASQVQQNMFNTTQQNLQPWMQQGNLALNALNQLSGLQQVIPYQQGVPSQPAQLQQPGQQVQGITQDQAMSTYGMTDPANAAKFASLNPATQTRLIQLAQGGNKTLFNQAAQQVGLVSGTNMAALASMPPPVQTGAQAQPNSVSGMPNSATGAPNSASQPQPAPGSPAMGPQISPIAGAQPQPAIPQPQGFGQPQPLAGQQQVPLSQIGAQPQTQGQPQTITANQARQAGLTDPKNIAAFGNLNPQQQAQLIQSAKTGNAQNFSKLAGSMGLNPGTRMNVVAGMSPILTAQPAVPANLAHVGTPTIDPMSQQPLGSTDPSAGGTFNQNAPLVKPFSLSDFQQSPAYQFNLQQGQQAIDKAANARGNLYAPQTLQDLSKYSQGVASNEFQNAYSNYNQNQQNLWNRLSSLSGQGQNAAAGIGALGAQTAGQIGQNTIGAGNAQAAGQIGQANAINSGLGNLYNAYLMNQILQRNNTGIAGQYGGGGFG